MAAEQLVAEGEVVGERQAHQRLVPALIINQFAVSQGVGHHLVMCQFGALGLSRGAGGIEDNGIRIARDSLMGRCLFHRFQQIRKGEGIGKLPHRVKQVAVLDAPQLRHDAGDL